VALIISHEDDMKGCYAALEYEREHGTPTLQPFFDSSIPKLQHPQIQSWGSDLLNERADLQSATREPSLSPQDA
jgi:putative hydrolase of HD superfamily